MPKPGGKKHKTIVNARHGDLCLTQDPVVGDRYGVLWPPVGPAQQRARRIPRHHSPVSAPLYEFIKDVKSSLRAKVRSRPFSVQKRAGLEALRTARLETMSQFTSMTDQPKSVKVVAKTGDDLTVTKARAAKSPKRRQRAIVQVNSRHCTRALAWDSKAREFAGKHNLLLVLNDIYEIALKCFRISGMPVVKYEVDPEDGGEYLVISAKVIGSVDDALESNDRFIDAALARYGLEALRLVRFLYAIM